MKLIDKLGKEFEIKKSHVALIGLLSSSLVFANYTSVMSSEGSMTDEPIGLVMLWVGESEPKGWDLMQGQSTAGNAELAKVFGSNVPDMTGRFVRGYGGKSGELNKVQAQDLESHTHTATFSGNKLPVHSHTYSSYNSSRKDKGEAPDKIASPSLSNIKTAGASGGRPTGTITVASSTGVETRPKNITVKFLVKVQ